jgi:DNA-binding MarR family transcriptional regulator
MESNMVTAMVRVLRKHLRVIEREVERQLKDQTVCCGVTSAQCHVLLELAEAGESSLVDLSERLKLDASTLSRTVDSLVKTGHAGRVADPENRRYVILALTPKGKRKVAYIDRTSDRFYQELLGQISESRRNALMESVGLLAGIFARTCEGKASAAAKAGGSRVGRKNARRK